MTKLTLPNSVKSIGEFAVDYWIELTLGSSLDSIGPKAFSSCYKLKRLEVLNPTPPAMGELVFRNADLSGTELVVPEESLEAYMNADQWKEFGSFRTAVKDVIVDDTRIYVRADNGSIVIEGADDAVGRCIRLPVRLSIRVRTTQLRYPFRAFISFASPTDRSRLR